jgi:hypothetical protein
MLQITKLLFRLTLTLLVVAIGYATTPKKSNDHWHYSLGISTTSSEIHKQTPEHNSFDNQTSRGYVDFSVSLDHALKNTWKNWQVSPTLSFSLGTSEESHTTTSISRSSGSLLKDTDSKDLSSKGLAANIAFSYHEWRHATPFVGLGYAYNDFYIPAGLNVTFNLSKQINAGINFEYQVILDNTTPESEDHDHPVIGSHEAKRAATRTKIALTLSKHKAPLSISTYYSHGNIGQTTINIDGYPKSHRITGDEYGLSLIWQG